MDCSSWDDWFLRFQLGKLLCRSDDNGKEVMMFQKSLAGKVIYLNRWGRYKHSVCLYMIGVRQFHLQVFDVD